MKIANIKKIFLQHTKLYKNIIEARRKRKFCLKSQLLDNTYGFYYKYMYIDT